MNINDGHNEETSDSCVTDEEEDIVRDDLINPLVAHLPYFNMFLLYS